MKNNILKKNNLTTKNLQKSFFFFVKFEIITLLK